MKAVEVKELVKNYGNFRAIKGISFEVNDGEIFGLIGPNGAG
jgi:ABC-2 type transport system ATP-binding protein